MEAELAGTWAGVLSPLDVVQGCWVCGRWAEAGDTVQRVSGNPLMARRRAGLATHTAEVAAALVTTGVLRLMMQDGGPNEEGVPKRDLSRHMGVGETSPIL